MAMTLYTQMAVIFEKAKRTPEFSALAAKVGYAEAERIVKQEIIQKGSHSYLMGASTAAIGMLIAAAAGALGISLGLTSVPAQAVGAPALTSTLTHTATNVIPGITRVAHGMANVVPAGGALPQWMTSILWGMGYAGGTVIGFNAVNAIIEGANGDGAKEKELKELAQKSDDFLRSIGFDDSAISELRNWYREYVGFGGGEDYVPSEPVNEMPKQTEAWIAHYKNLVNKGLQPQDAVSGTEAVFGWRLDDATLLPMVYADYEYQQGQLPTEQSQTNDWLTQYQKFRSAGLSDSAAYAATVSLLGYAPKDFEPPQEAVDESSSYMDWYEIYNNLRREGLTGEIAASQATDMTGYSPPESVLAGILAQDESEDYASLREGIDNPSFAEVMSQFQDALYTGFSPAPPEEEWMQDVKYEDEYRNRYSNFSPSDVEENFTPKKQYGEAYMAKLYKGRDGIWRWSSGAPVNGARSSRYGRKTTYRRRF